MADMQRHEWNMPKHITTRCPECEGQGSVMRSVAGGTTDGTITHSLISPSRCKACGGRGRFDGMQPPV